MKNMRGQDPERPFVKQSWRIGVVWYGLLMAVAGVVVLAVVGLDYGLSLLIGPAAATMILFTAALAAWWWFYEPSYPETPERTRSDR